MVKRTAKLIVLGVYATGSWVYGIGYIWEHWAEYEKYGSLGW